MRNKTIILLSAGALFTLLVSLHSGAAPLSWSDLISFFRGGPTPDTQAYLIGTLRVPRTLAAFFIGASLGVCGLVLQTLLRNPLAEPYTLGLSGGSSFGAVIALLLNVQPITIWVPFFSAIGCLMASGLVLGFAHSRLQYESRSLILFGVMVSLFFGAMVVCGLSFLSPDKMQAALLWLMGELGSSRDPWIYFAIPILVSGLMLIFMKSKTLDALILGEVRAYSLGFSPRSDRIYLILICTALISVCVSISGLVGFIGLVSPHIARRLERRSIHKTLIISSWLVGGILFTLADSAARQLSSQTEVPAGSLAALMGAPLLIYLLFGGSHAQAD